MGEFIIKKPAHKDSSKIKELLERSGLPFKDIDKHLLDFLIGESDNKIIAVAGLEIYDDIALMRSLAVEESFRNIRIGEQMVEAIIEHARAKKIHSIYLLTETAENYFSDWGFIKINRDTAPEQIKNTEEFVLFCPTSAIVMMKKL